MRSFNTGVGDAGRPVVTVTITAANYGQGGGVTETLPAGFTCTYPAALTRTRFYTLARQSGSPCKGMIPSLTQLPPRRTTGPITFSGVLRETTGDGQESAGWRRFHGNALEGHPLAAEAAVAAVAVEAAAAVELPVARVHPPRPSQLTIPQESPAAPGKSSTCRRT